MNLSNIKWMKEGAVDLLVESYSSSSMVLQIRGLDENEMIIADHTTSANRSLVSSVVAITAMPRLLTVRSTSTNVRRGTCFVRISLRVEGVIMATLFADYVTDTGAPAYPNGRIQSSTEGPGLIRSITGTDPAAGSEISETVPTNALWRLWSFRYTLVTDATVINRDTHFSVTDGANLLLRASQGSATTATQTIINNFFTRAFRGGASVSGERIGLLPDFNMPAGYVFGTTTTNLQAGDNMSAPQYVVEEWINP